jgi:ribose transport system substrate-binding protein
VKRRQIAVIASLAALTASCGSGASQSSSGSVAEGGKPLRGGEPVSLPEGYSSRLSEGASTPVDTSPFKKNPPWKVGVSAAYLDNSWAVYTLAELKYHAARNKQFSDNVFDTNAGGDAGKQISDVEDMINRGVDVILYWAVDDTAILPALEKANAAGIPTINIGGAFIDKPGVTTNAVFDAYEKGVQISLRLAKDLDGKGKVVNLLPIDGLQITQDHDQAARDVFGKYPGIEVLDVQHGDWNRAKSKSIAEAWLLKYPEIDGVLSSSGNMMIGVAEAFEEAGRLDEVTFSVADEYNGWLKWLAAHPENASGGVITEGPMLSARAGIELAAKILAGKKVSKGERIQALFYPASDADRLADMSGPDDAWLNDLPPEFRP